jgi:FAD/FMN-containing dehydrogenase/Fe-S oxidoreductase
MAETTAKAAKDTTRGLETALRQEVRGDVEFGAGTRAAYATDSSNYRHPPIGVVFPRDHADVVATLRVCARYDAPVFGRGAGTSLAGQACNAAVVVDFSRHMTSILGIDPVARTARVQPGVVLDDLRREAERHGLTFGPDPATHAWCTLGGMIGNNSCGTHTLSAGKTVDNVESLKVVTYGGAEYEFGEYDAAQYAALVKAGAPEAPLLGSLREIGRRAAPLVRERYPDIARRVSGYNLDRIDPDRPLHVARLLVGTESTCALVTEAVVRLAPSPRYRSLLVLAYPSVFEAADAVADLLRALPPDQGLLGLEGFDATLVRQMRARDLNTGHLRLLPGVDEAVERGAGGWLLAEIGGDDDAAVDERVGRFVGALPEAAAYRRLDDPAEQRGAWAVRESGLGATALREDGGHNAEGWEDAAVAPERLGEYLRGITALWERFGYSGAWYGHFGEGCVHTRNNFDLHTPEGLRTYRAYVECAADLVVSLGGSLSGEHGDGQSRGELLERMYGPEIIEAFRQVKAVFDPRGRMNPGKIVDAYPLDANLRYGPDYRIAKQASRTYFPLLDDDGSLQHAAERCVGVGRCRRDDAGVMCPSYRATRDERHSTRGRAKLLVELFQGSQTPGVWRDKEVRAALDLCLACKGCAVDCPTHVDLATYKAEFLAHYYRGRLRPRSMYALALTPWLARLAGRSPRPANAVLTLPGISTLIKRAGGVATGRAAPSFAARPLRREQALTAPGAGARLSSAGGGAARSATSVVGSATVVIWPDTFTDAYRPGVGLDWKRVFEAVGERVAVPTRWACCGRPLYDAGMLKLARRTLRRLLDVLAAYIDAGLPIVVPEPSCLAAFRDELPKLLHEDPRAARLAELAKSPAEFLLAIGAAPRITGGPASDAGPGSGSLGEILVHPHCHTRAIRAEGADRDLLAALGYQVTMLDAGCCGLAGSFGFSAEHEALSRQIGEEQWLPGLRGSAERTGADTVVIDGFSCATQYEQLGGGVGGTQTGPVAVTLAQLLSRAVEDGVRRRSGNGGA